jgi:hypothetical protein
MHRDNICYLSMVGVLTNPFNICYLTSKFHFRISIFEFRIFKSNIQHSIPMHRDNICYPTSKFNFRISIFEFRISHFFLSMVGVLTNPFKICYLTFKFHFRISIFEFRISFCPWLVSSPIHSTFNPDASGQHLLSNIQI